MVGARVAHFEFTRKTLTVLCEKIEDLREAGASTIDRKSNAPRSGSHTASPKPGGVFVAEQRLVDQRRRLPSLESPRAPHQSRLPSGRAM
jgi:hypothetical protein